MGIQLSGGADNNSFEVSAQLKIKEMPSTLEQV